MAKMILKATEIDYSDLERYGRVTIEYGSDGARITVDGFDFAEPASCRQHVAKAMSWARDVLAVEIEANRIIPGGHLVGVLGLDQDGLEEEKKSSIADM